MNKFLGAPKAKPQKKTENRCQKKVYPFSANQNTYGLNCDPRYYVSILTASTPESDLI